MCGRRPGKGSEEVADRPRVAVVLPTLDEEDALGRHLADLMRVCHDVVVSDGGSRDATRTVAAQMGARVLYGAAGRGAQLRRGVELALESDPEVLLFLHADTVLPPDATTAIGRAIAAGAVGGGFLVRFDDRRPLLRLGEKLINLRTRIFEVPLGDQAQFVSRRTYEEMGGYRDWPILEDLDLILRLRRRGPLSILSPPVTTSARRFVQRGILRTVGRNWLIWTLFFCGVSPQRLARLYRQIR